jgi:hypothetical protein
MLPFPAFSADAADSHHQQHCSCGRDSDDEGVDGWFDPSCTCSHCIIAGCDLGVRTTTVGVALGPLGWEELGGRAVEEQEVIVIFLKEKPALWLCNPHWRSLGVVGVVVVVTENGRVEQKRCHEDDLKPK